MPINPNSDRDFIKECNIDDVAKFPLFFKQIKFESFRHISNLEINFINPITVITGSNKAGKTTILLSIACSHYNFKRRNVANGSLERARWGNTMRFTSQDIQRSDWTYHVIYREGRKTLNKRGQRKAETKKWNGVAKKESQIGTPTTHRPDGGRNVVLIDLERIIPSRNLSSRIFNQTKNQLEIQLTNFSVKNEYLSYVLEQEYSIGSLVKSADKEIFIYHNSENYSSYNTASGEDVLTRIISDIVDTENNSLILIEELEIGLHPKIQRRLMDIIYHESKKNNKQFIITTHSSTILSSVEPNSRIYIENNNGTFKSISNISINASLSKMDSISYPLINVFIEDDIAEKIVNKAITQIVSTIKGFNNLINPIIIGSAEETYKCFKVHQQTHGKKKINCGFACILDGDMKSSQANRALRYPSEDGLFFLYSNHSPEKMLLKEYLNHHGNTSLSYHVNSNPHCLFDKMIQEGICSTKKDAFDMCWAEFISNDYGQEFFNQLQTFLIERCRYFSPGL
jgi:predicted ATPase